MSQIRVLRLLEYVYDNAEEMARDMRQWAVQGTWSPPAGRGGPDITIRSVTLPLDVLTEPVGAHARSMPDTLPLPGNPALGLCTSHAPFPHIPRELCKGWVECEPKPKVPRCPSVLVLTSLDECHCVLDSGHADVHKDAEGHTWLA